MKFKEYVKVPSKAPYAWVLQVFILFILSSVVQVTTYMSYPVLANNFQACGTDLFSTLFCGKPMPTVIATVLLLLFLLIVAIQILFNSALLIVSVVKGKVKFNGKKIGINILFFILLLVFYFVINIIIQIFGLGTHSIRSELPSFQ